MQLLSKYSKRDKDKKLSCLLFCKRRMRAVILRSNANCKSMFVEHMCEEVRRRGDYGHHDDPD